MGIEPLQTQEPISWETEKKFHILRLAMFGAFYPNYFVKVTLAYFHMLRDTIEVANLHIFVGEQRRFGEAS